MNNLEEIKKNSVMIIKNITEFLTNSDIIKQNEAEEIAYSLAEMPTNILEIYNNIFPVINNANSTKEEIEDALNELLLAYQRIDYLMHAATYINLGKMEWSNAVDNLYTKK